MNMFHFLKPKNKDAQNHTSEPIHIKISKFSSVFEKSIVVTHFFQIIYVLIAIVTIVIAIVGFCFMLFSDIRLTKGQSQTIYSIFHLIVSIIIAILTIGYSYNSEEKIQEKPNCTHVDTNAIGKKYQAIISKTTLIPRTESALVYEVKPLLDPLNCIVIKNYQAVFIIQSFIISFVVIISTILLIISSSLAKAYYKLVCGNDEIVIPYWGRLVDMLMNLTLFGSFLGIIIIYFIRFIYNIHKIEKLEILKNKYEAMKTLFLISFSYYISQLILIMYEDLIANNISSIGNWKNTNKECKDYEKDKSNNDIIPEPNLALQILYLCLNIMLLIIIWIINICLIAVSGIYFMPINMVVSKGSQVVALVIQIFSGKIPFDKIMAKIKSIIYPLTIDKLLAKIPDIPAEVSQAEVSQAAVSRQEVVKRSATR